MKTTVVHCMRTEFDIYIGRFHPKIGGSMWGNPFIIGRDGTREEVIAKHRAWLLKRPQDMKMLHMLKGKRLGCWCAPNACHGDTLAELADALSDTE